MNCLECNGILSLHSKNPFIGVELKLERCFGCGILIKNALNFYYCPSHKQYLVCSECRLCSKGHFLQKCVFLNKINPLYVNNKFQCNICMKTKIVNDNGIWHCENCTYDVCEECLP